MPSSKVKCPRTVHPNKYNRKVLKTTRWNKVVQKEKQTIGIHDCSKTLEQILPNQLIDRLLHVLNLMPTSTMSLESLNDWVFTTEPTKSVQSDQQPAVKVEKSITRYEIGKSNPYLEFFKRPPNRAAIWYPLPRLSLNEMHLTQKADTIVEQIAKEFVDWMLELCQQDGVTPTTLTVNEIIKMFQIGFNTQAARTLCVCFKEIAAIPDQVATLKQLPQLSKRNMLYRQIKRDIKASKQQRKLQAFGRTLPPDLQIHPPNYETIKNNWLKCERIREDLHSMATVFQNITHLPITRSFCKYLLEHPEISPPNYLKDIGMLNVEYLQKLDLTSDEEEEEDDDDDDDGNESLPSINKPTDNEEIEEQKYEDVVFGDDDLFDDEDNDGDGM